jgi:hypothetical protein
MLAAWFLGLCVFTISLIIVPDFAYVPGHIVAMIALPISFVWLLYAMRRKQ